MILKSLKSWQVGKWFYEPEDFVAIYNEKSTKICMSDLLSQINLQFLMPVRVAGF